MIDFLPQPSDNLSYYIYTPQKDTLYGSTATPLQFLRVTDSVPGGVRNYQTMQCDPSDPSSLSTIETVDISTFLEFASYGYTPYLEVAFCSHPTAFDFEPHKDYLIAQSAFRNYEQRCQTLLDLCREKRYSVIARMDDDTTERLVSELKGSLLMWEMLMNTGIVRASDCLKFAPEEFRGSFPLKTMEAKFEELQERSLMSNFVNIPYKVTESKRADLLTRFA